MDKCQHGFNAACLICGFSQIDGNKVWFDWAYQNQKVKVQELQQENQRLADGNTSYYNQAIKQNEIIEGQQGQLKQAYEDIEIFAMAHKRECEFKSQLAKDKAELQKRVDAALEDMEMESLKLKEGYDGYKDPVGICQSEGIEIARKILEQALKGKTA